tara:strand:+ start:754 stop:2490 length:1737 start_codon:yes stop_codon:yes gene_type:complete
MSSVTSFSPEVIAKAIQIATTNSILPTDDDLIVEYDQDIFWEGDRSDMSDIDAYVEIILNVLDKNSMSDSMNDLNLYMTAEKKGDTIVALEFLDDGDAPFYSHKQFMDEVVKKGVKTKRNVKGVNGEAGIGAKDSAARLGRKFTFEWCPANGHPSFSLTFEKKNWNGRPTKDIDENYNGPPFFKLRVEELNGNVNRPSRVRDRLSHIFSDALRRHPNVNIYTCQPNKVNDFDNLPLQPAPPVEIDKSLPYFDGVVDTYMGVPIVVKIGKLVEEKHSGAPHIAISKHGVKYVDGYHKQCFNAIFTGTNGKPLTNLSFVRDVYISIDCEKIEATTVKNKIQWETSEANQNIIAAVTSHSEFDEAWRGIYAYHLKGADKSINTHVLADTVNEKLNKVTELAAQLLNDMVKTSSVTNQFLSKSVTDISGTSHGKYVAKVTKSSKKKNMKRNNTTKNNVVKVNGKNKPLVVNYTDNCSLDKEGQRAWLDPREDVIYVTVNEKYEGYTPEIKKDGLNKLPLYIAETIGYVLHTERLNQLVSDSEVTIENLTDLNKQRDYDTGLFIKTMTTSSNKSAGKKKSKKS